MKRMRVRLRGLGLIPGRGMVRAPRSRPSPWTVLIAAIFWSVGGRGALGAPQVSPPSLRPPEVTPQVETAIRRGLEFLRSVQSADGAFGASPGNTSVYPTVMSAMVGLCFLADGSTPTRGPYAREIQRITDYLLKNSVTSSGLLTNRNAWEDRPMYGHAFAMAFLAHVYGQEGDAIRRRRIHEALTRAIRLTSDVQSREGGWGYEARIDQDEGTLTVTQTQALRACRDAGLHVSRGVIDNAIRYIERSANPDGSIRYRTTSPAWNTRPGVTCAAVVTLWSAGRYDDPLLRRIVSYIDRQVVPEWEQPRFAWYRVHHAEYVLYYLSQAKLFLGGRDWAPFYRNMADKLLAVQELDGSWSGKDSRQYGQIYTTAIALLVLQLPYNRLPLYQH